MKCWIHHHIMWGFSSLSQRKMRAVRVYMRAYLYFIHRSSLNWLNVDEKKPYKVAEDYSHCSCHLASISCWLCIEWLASKFPYNSIYYKNWILKRVGLWTAMNRWNIKFVIQFVEYEQVIETSFYSALKVYLLEMHSIYFLDVEKL